MFASSGNDGNQELDFYIVGRGNRLKFNENNAIKIYVNEYFIKY